MNTAFWARVDKSAECWLWTGKKTSLGYGQFGTAYAHRLVVGARRGEVVRHLCDTPSCVRPSHLRIGTQADNISDMRSKGREARGERVGTAKLTQEQVDEIRFRRALGEPQSSIAVAFGISQPNVSRLTNNKTWRKR